MTNNDDESNADDDTIAMPTPREVRSERPAATPESLQKLAMQAMEIALSFSLEMREMRSVHEAQIASLTKRITILEDFLDSQRPGEPEQ